MALPFRAQKISDLIISTTYGRTKAKMTYLLLKNSFTESREFVTHLGYYQDREKAIAALDLDSTDEPIVSAFADLSFCFPLQSCFGHFVCNPDQNKRTLRAKNWQNAYKSIGGRYE